MCFNFNSSLWISISHQVTVTADPVVEQEEQEAAAEEAAAAAKGDDGTMPPSEEGEGGEPGLQLTDSSGGDNGNSNANGKENVDGDESRYGNSNAKKNTGAEAESDGLLPFVPNEAEIVLILLI